MSAPIFNTFLKPPRFLDLIEAVQHCNLCSRLGSRVKILSTANGNIESKVIFIAEAPGRLGADRTGIPLYGDKTGQNFEALLGNIGWKRKDLFITNALLCNPRQENGNNDTPTLEEIENCVPYLEMVIELIKPEVIVTLGATALKAIDLIYPHGIVLRDAVAQPSPWRGRTIFPLYHPGPRAAVHRSLPKQRSDFMMLAKLVSPSKGIIARKTNQSSKKNYGHELIHPSIMHKIIFTLVKQLRQLTLFKLTKLLYLIDLFSLHKYGGTLTGHIYLRQADGPWPPGLKNIVRELDKNEIIASNRNNIIIVKLGPSPRFEIDLDDKSLELINNILTIYGNMSNQDIKVAAYRTMPMRYILEQEKLGRKMANKPVLYNNMTAKELDQVGV